MAQTHRFLRSNFLIFAIGAITFFIYTYLSGSSISDFLLPAAILLIFLALASVHYYCTIQLQGASLWSRSSYLIVITGLVMVLALSEGLLRGYESRLFNDKSLFSSEFLLTASFGLLGLNILQLFLVVAAIRFEAIRKILISKKEHQEPNSESLATMKDSEYILGLSESTKKVVIQSILSRAVSARKKSSQSLVLMVVLVFLGGGASVGTILLNEISIVRELEIKRGNLEQLVREIDPSVLVRKPENRSSSQRMTRSEWILDEAGSLTSSEELANAYREVVAQSTLQWQDIVLRISIAVLTLFLVQVFFQIFKYNQQQAAYLFSKAELLELHQTDTQTEKELILSLISHMDSGPKFGKTPSNPTEQALAIVEKFVKK